MPLIWLLQVSIAAADPFINEILFNPPGTDSPNQYIELRGKPNYVFPPGSYFVSVEGNTNNNVGSVQHTFDLSGKVIGGNGFLVLLQKTNSFAAHNNAAVYANTGTGPGWGSGSSSSLGHKGQSGDTDIDHGSQTFLLICTTNSPAIGDDIDLDDNATPDGSVFAGWVIQDSVGVVTSAGEVSYGAINFRKSGGLGPGENVPVSFTPGYLGRSTNSTSSSAGAWVAGDAVGTAPTYTLDDASHTVPTSFAMKPLNHLGAPNFGAAAYPGVVVRESGGSTDLLEGSGTDSYTIALNTTPSGSVTIQIVPSGHTQISIDNGASYQSSARSLTFSSTNPRTVLVRVIDDTVVDTSPHTNRISHAVTITGDPTRYPTNLLGPIVHARITENDLVLLNELKVNPPGTNDEPFEYIEIKGVPSTGLRNVYLLALEGDLAGDPGITRLAVNLDKTALGGSGLMIIAAPGHPYTIPNETTVVLAPTLARPGGGLGNGSMSFLLVTSPAAIPEGVDLDAGDNGVMEGLPEGSTILDAVAWSDGDPEDILYGGVVLHQSGGTPDAATRFAYLSTPLSAAAWFNGDLQGNNGDSLAYDDDHVSSNFPFGAVLSPGVFVNSPPGTAPLPAFSGVIGDPTNPKLEFTVNDAETEPEFLLVTATSGNPAVVPDANLTITAGPGGQRYLHLEPVGVGYATVFITVDDGDELGQSTLEYAASSMGRPDGRFHAGISDASTAMAIDPEWMFVADDENQVLRIFSRDQSGAATAQFNMNSFLDLTDFYPNGKPREVDIEGSTRVGDRIFWMGAHSHAQNAEARTNRGRIFATDVTGTGSNSVLTFVGHYDYLKLDLINWDVNNLHGKGANYYGLAASGAEGVDPKSPDGSGFNLEGLCMAPGSTTTAYLGFRAPLVPPTNRTFALIVPLTNFTGLAAHGGELGSARFGTPIELDLNGHGIRSMEGSSSNYLVVAGPPDVATEVWPKDLKLFTWTGHPNDRPQQRSANLSGLIPEGIVELPPSPWSDTSQVQLLSDNGITIYYGDGIQAKHLPEPNWKKFRTDWVTLGSIEIPQPHIRSLVYSGDSLTITWKSVPGHTYRVLQRLGLAVGEWTAISGDVTATDSFATKVLANGGSRQCFYRVVLVP